MFCVEIDFDESQFRIECRETGVSVSQTVLASCTISTEVPFSDPSIGLAFCKRFKKLVTELLADKPENANTEFEAFENVAIRFRTEKMVSWADVMEVQLKFDRTTVEIRNCSDLRICQDTLA